MPERNLLICKLKVLEKYKEELIEKVKFSDLSHHLITSSLLTREDCFDICILPLEQQMRRCYEKLVNILEMEKDESKETDFWTVFLRALNAQHSGLTCKLDGELHKLAKREKPRRLTKDDIGTPLHFQHIRHIGNGQTYSSPIRRFLSLRWSSSVNTSSSSVDENDPDVQTFFAQAGVTDVHLKRPNSRRVILDFIERNGGMEAIRQEVRLTSTGSSISETPLSSPTEKTQNEESESPSPLPNPFS